MRAAILACLLGAALLAGCGGGDDGPAAATTTAAAASSEKAPATATTTIAIKDFEFDPTPATVKVGQKITVQNADAAPHTLTDRPASGKPLFDTGTVKGKQAGSFTAGKPGTYEVYCVIHPFMKGEVTVVS